MTRDRVRCPACEDREALRNDGGPKIIGGGQLNGATKDVGLTTAAAGCEVCQGKGWLPPTDQEARDPYSLPLTEDQAARLRRTRMRSDSKGGTDERAHARVGPVSSRGVDPTHL